jgi:hypothetical protein
LASVGGGKALEVAAQTGTGTKSAGIDQGMASSCPPQQWIVDLTSDGNTYRLRPCATHEVSLSVAAGRGRKKTAALTAAQWANLPTQKWSFGRP